MHLVRTGAAELQRLVAAVLLLTFVVVMLDTGPAGSTEWPSEIGARAQALRSRWDQMVVDGVPAWELAELESEWSVASRMTVRGAPLFAWSQAAAQIVGRWETETDAIWDRDLAAAHSAATAAASALHRALGVEPASDRKARAEELADASTPAALDGLANDWALEAILVPLDRGVAVEVGLLTALVRRAAALSVVSDPAAAEVARAAAYASEADRIRRSQAVALVADLRAVVADLAARLDAASKTQPAFASVQDLIHLAGQWGVGTASYQAALNSEWQAYRTAASVAQFAAIAASLASMAARLRNAIAAAQHTSTAVVNQTYVIGGIAFYYQTHALSCEETSMSMALTHQGIHLSQNQILAQLGSDRRPQYYDSHGVLHWGDPYVSFVGNVNGIENVTGLQANYTALVRVALANGARVVAAGNISASAIYAQIAAGHPVVVYATWDWRWHPRHDYVAFDGRRIPFIGPAASHVYVAVGVRPDAVLVNDPIRGQYWVSKGAFQAAYSDFTEAIVFA